MLRRRSSIWPRPVCAAGHRSFAVAVAVAAVASIGSGESDGSNRDVAGLPTLELNASCVSPPPGDVNPQFVCSVKGIPHDLPWLKAEVAGGAGGGGYTTGWKFAEEASDYVVDDGKL